MAIKQKIIGAVKIIRPELPIAAGICVIIGEVLADETLPGTGAIILGFALGFFLSSSAMIFNDIFDLEVDRINSPQRPLPAGLLTMKEAVFLGVFSLAISLIIAGFFSLFVVLLTLVAWALGFIYNWKLKAAGGILGNLIVSANVAGTFIIGGIVAGHLWNGAVWVFGAIAFFFDLAEEIAGDAMDMEGDKKRDSKSIAITAGRKTAMNISTILFWLVVLLTILPVALGENRIVYIIPISIMDILIIIFSVKLHGSRSPAMGRAFMRVLYLTASLGLLIFLIGKVIFLMPHR